MGFILALVSIIVAAAVWETLEDFLCRVAKTILPEKYGEKASEIIEKVVGVVRKLGDIAELVFEVADFFGDIEELETEEVSWSEVPYDVKQEIQQHGEYRQEYAA